MNSFTRWWRKTRIHNRSVFKKALSGIPENAVVFNCGAWNAVPCMFYVTCTAADVPPSEAQLQAAKSNSDRCMCSTTGNYLRMSLQILRLRYWRIRWEGMDFRSAAQTSSKFANRQLWKSWASSIFASSQRRSAMFFLSITSVRMLSICFCFVPAFMRRAV